MASLEGWNFTIKLCPRGIKLPRRGSNANSFFGKSLNHCQFFSAPCCLEPQCTRGKTQFVRSRGPGVSPDVYLSKAVATSVALWPPKPKELLKATRTFFSRATFGV